MLFTFDYMLPLSAPSVIFSFAISPLLLFSQVIRYEQRVGPLERPSSSSSSSLMLQQKKYASTEPLLTFTPWPQHCPAISALSRRWAQLVALQCVCIICLCWEDYEILRISSCICFLSDLKSKRQDWYRYRGKIIVGHVHSGYYSYWW